MNLMKKARSILKDQLANDRRDGLTTLDGITLPPAIALITKRNLNDALKKVLEEEWTKMMKRWNRLVYAGCQGTLDAVWERFKKKLRSSNI